MSSPRDAFEWDPNTDEPFLRLPKPLENIIITPPRLSDADVIIVYLNDPRVYMTLEGAPYPYTEEDAISWQTMIQERSNKILDQIKNGQRVFDGSPVRAIRQINDDGTQTFLGDCQIDRW